MNDAFCLRKSSRVGCLIIRELGRLRLYRRLRADIIEVKLGLKPNEQGGLNAGSAIDAHFQNQY
jgi:hypothetical protein